MCDAEWIHEQYDKLVAESRAYLNDVQQAAASTFRIGSYQRFFWDQDRETIEFSDMGVVKVVARIQFVGSISNKTNTWLWSWANDSVLPGIRESLWAVKAYGERNDFWQLHVSKWEADETDGWTMTAIAAKLLKAKGAYRTQDGDGFTFMVYTDINWASNDH